MSFTIQALPSVNNPKSVHGIYPYRGKIAALDAQQIVRQMDKGKVLLDPFCGSGTIIYEGVKAGLKTIGIDANPIAAILSRGKTNIPPILNLVLKEAYSLFDGYSARESNYHYASAEVREHEELYIPGLFEKEGDCAVTPKDSKGYSESLFHPQTYREILTATAHFSEMSDYLKACVLGTICLAARGCNQYKWTSSSVGKSIEPKRYINFQEKLYEKIKKHYFPISNNSQIIEADSRNISSFIKPNTIDYVYTSPPYFDCLDYTAYYAKIIYDILRVNRIEIRKKLIQNFENYKEDMQLVLQELYTVCKPGANIIFVVGDKKIHNKLISGVDFFQEISPFVNGEVIERSYSGTSSQVFDKLNKTERKEQIIIWTK